MPTVTTDDFVNFATDKPENKSRVINLSQYGPTYFGPEHAQVLLANFEWHPILKKGKLQCQCRLSVIKSKNNITITCLLDWKWLIMCDTIVMTEQCNILLTTMTILWFYLFEGNNVEDNNSVVIIGYFVHTPPVISMLMFIIVYFTNKIVRVILRQDNI